MRCLPLLVIACVFCGFTPVWAQQLQCDPCAHGFGKVQLGDSSSFSFQLSNTGSGTLVISSIKVRGARSHLAISPYRRILPPAQLFCYPLFSLRLPLDMLKVTSH